MLRDIILKSIVPSNLDAEMPHKRPLDGSFYGGKLAVHSNDDANVVLSRGNVHRLLNGHWMLCQNGCVDCEPCAGLKDPLFKWTLRKITATERPLNADSPRHELQLTITPQANNDRLHANDFWPNSYVYVASRDNDRGETSTVSGVATPLHGDDITDRSANRETAKPSRQLDDSFSTQHQRSRNPWRLAERDSANVDRRDRNGVRESALPGSTEKELQKEQKHSPRQNPKPRHRHRPRLTENPDEEANQLAPKLILGIDRRGQKHLVHVVPIDQPPAKPHSANRLSSQVKQTRSNDTAVPRRESHTYHRIFRRVFDSLSTHRRSIEDFFEADDNGRHHRTPLVGANGTGGFTRRNDDNRDANHTAINFAPPRRGDTLSPFYVANEDRTMERRQYRGRYGYEDIGRHRDANYVEKSFNRLPMGNLDRGEERRKLPSIESYTDDGKSSISTVLNPSIGSSQISGNLSVNARPEPFDNGVFVDGTLVGEASNNSVKPARTTTARGNNGRELFGSESGNADRELDASHHPFRMLIVTTDSPMIIHGRREILNHSKTLQITTLKTLVDVS